MPLEPEHLLILFGVFAVLGLLCLGWLGYGLRRLSDRQTDPQALQMMQNQLNANNLQMSQYIDTLRQQIQQVNTQLLNSLDSGQKNVGLRLDGAAKTISDVNVQLGKLDESSKRIFEIGQDVSRLQKILQSPKLRGNISELFLHDLLAQILPAGHFSTQYGFKGGETVDAVISLKLGMVPIDAKFPLENFRRLNNAENESDRKAAKKVFARDVKVHIDSISSKYIRPDEGTLDFAFMYIPAENVYYEIIVRDDTQVMGVPLLDYALNKRVIPASPNTFYAYLQTILLGLKGLQVEENARQIIDHLFLLRREFERLSDSFRLVGQHLDNSVKKFQEAEKRLDKFETQVVHVETAAHAVEESKAEGADPG